MDLENVTIKSIIPVEIKNPVTGENTGIVINVYSPESKEFKQAKHKVRNERLQQKGVELTSEMVDINSCKLSAEVTASWENLEEGGAETECTPDNAMRIYLKHGWIYEQVESALDRKSSFLEFAPQS